MASGAGRRFGSNKLLADAGGLTVAERTLLLAQSLTASAYIRRDNICIITRYRDICDKAAEYSFRGIMHSEPDKSDTVRIAVRELHNTDGIIFLQADQFLLSVSSVLKLVESFLKAPEQPARLCSGERQGSPVIFPPSYYSSLTELEGDTGGNVLLYNRPVTKVEAYNAYELWDADTPDELDRMKLFLNDGIL